MSIRKIAKNFGLLLISPVGAFYYVAKKSKHHELIVGYYATLMLVALLTIFILIRWSTQVIEQRIIIQNIHIHHFVVGIVLQNIAFFLLLARSKTERVYTWAKHMSALLFGAGLGLILDELQVFLKLDSAPHNFQYRGGIVLGSVIMILIILADFFIKKMKDRSTA